MKLLKYQPIDKQRLSALVKKKIWVADPRKFNDPFEFTLTGPYKWDGSKIVYLNQDEFNNRQRIFNEISAYGVISYSIADGFNDGTQEGTKLLWAHYGDDHKGMCLVFEVPNSNKKGVRKVIYQDSYPEINYEVHDENLRDEIIKIITTKPHEWEYEHEYRQVFTKKEYLEEYPGELKEIIFGCRATFDDILLVLKILEDQIDQINFSIVKPAESMFKLQKMGAPNSKSFLEIANILTSSTNIEML